MATEIDRISDNRTHTHTATATGTESQNDRPSRPKQISLPDLRIHTLYIFLDSNFFDSFHSIRLMFHIKRGACGIIANRMEMERTKTHNCRNVFSNFFSGAIGVVVIVSYMVLCTTAASVAVADASAALFLNRPRDQFQIRLIWILFSFRLFLSVRKNSFLFARVGHLCPCRIEAKLLFAFKKFFSTPVLFKSNRTIVDEIERRERERQRGRERVKQRNGRK